MLVHPVEYYSASYLGEYDNLLLVITGLVIKNLHQQRSATAGSTIIHQVAIITGV